MRKTEAWSTGTQLDLSVRIYYLIFYMRIAARLPKSFTIEAELNTYVDETKGDRSASERVNELLRLAMMQEQFDKLEAEAAEFFADGKSDRAETRAFQKESLRTFSRD